MTPTLDLDDDLGTTDVIPPQRTERVHPADAEFEQARVVTEPAEQPAFQPQRNGHAPTQVEPDPETRLLACCLIEEDNGAVLARCEEAGLIGDSFSDPKRGLVYSRLQSMRREGKPISTATLAIEMTAARELADVGGYDYIVQISSTTPTTAQAAYFVERVREGSILREIIRQSKRRAELAASPSADLSELLDDYRRDANAVSAKGVAGEAASLMARAFDASRLMAKPDRIYSISGITVCTPGNLTALYSQAKTGKSSFMSAMIGAAMTNPTSGHDTLGIEGPNYANHAVVHFDTEQSPYDWQQLVTRSLKRVGRSTPPPWLMSFTIAGLESQKAEQFVHAALRLARKTHGGIHSVFIDGVADLVNDPNSPDECFPLLARLHGAAIEYNTAIINILHLNPTAKDKSDKGRGHLGSQLERKCESNLTLKKDGEITVVVAEGRQRGRPIPEGKGPAFKWSDEHGMHRSCKNPAQDSEPKAQSARRDRHMISEFMQFIPGPGKAAMSIRQIYKYASGVSTIKELSLKDLLKEASEDGILEQSLDPSLGICYRKVL